MPKRLTDELTPLQEQAMDALLAGERSGKVALQVKVDRTVLWAWQKTPAWKREWDRRRAEGTAVLDARRVDDAVFARKVLRDLAGGFVAAVTVRSPDATGTITRIYFPPHRVPPAVMLNAALSLLEIEDIDPPEAPVKVPATASGEAAERYANVVRAIARAKNNPAALAALHGQKKTAWEDLKAAREAETKTVGVHDGIDRVVEMAMAAPPSVLDALIGKLTEARADRAKVKG